MRRSALSTEPIQGDRSSFCILYRTGTTSAFVWHRTKALTLIEAQHTATAMTQNGTLCNIENYFASVAVGLPTTFAPDFPLAGLMH